MRAASGLLLLLLSLTGCARASWVDARVPGKLERRHWSHHFLYGMVAGSELDVRDACGSARARRVEVGADGLTLLVSVVTLGLYTPRRIWVECAQEQRQ